MTIAAVGLGLSAVSAFGQLQAGKIQQRAYEIQARQARLRSDAEMVQEKQRGNEVLRGIGRTLATINARAAAGSIDPYSGTPEALRVFATSEGMEDFRISQENAQLIEQAGILQEIELKQAGSFAAYQGRMGALTTLGQGVASYAMLGGAPKPSGSTGLPGGTAPGYTTRGALS
jgi:hypothetical protein